MKGNNIAMDKNSSPILSSCWKWLQASQRLGNESTIHGGREIKCALTCFFQE